MDKVNLADKLALISGQWQAKVVGEINDMYVKLVKLEGEFLWHSHDWEDEMFFVVEGEMVMRYRDRDVIIGPGEFIIVPHGVEHMPVCREKTNIMLIEPKATVNTGNAGGERTVEPEWI
ncbi:MAG: cupin domain-containing protein [Proteobacteria bacterium]|nr:cupin domain-containing protein [Pseudomonadota bacterium]MBU1612029.1 cupin domain-containing protein [Pseudomonadota bacterium]